jgi:glycosyltransferase involved in cell wall biosynthesis
MKNKNLVKYSIIIPVYNGLNTLKITLPNLLENLNRNDIEIVVVDNCSTDGLEFFLQDLKDHRLKSIRLNLKAKAGDSLSAGINRAEGDWIIYMGDDDQIINEIFNHFDKILRNNNFDILIGHAIRLIWPNNGYFTILTNKFNEAISIKKGSEICYTYLDKLSINAGGSFIIKKSLYSDIKKQYGIYSTPQGVEFFILRAAMFLAKDIGFINLPFFIHGRSYQGWGESLEKNSRWDLDIEWNLAFSSRTFWHKKLYTAISYDAAKRVADANNAKLNEYFWIRQYINEILFTNNVGRLDGNPYKIFFLFLKNLKINYSKNYILYAILFYFAKIPLYFIRKVKNKIYPKDLIRDGYTVKISGFHNEQIINVIANKKIEELKSLSYF